MFSFLLKLFQVDVDPAVWSLWRLQVEMLLNVCHTMLQVFPLFCPPLNDRICIAVWCMDFFFKSSFQLCQRTWPRHTAKQLDTCRRQFPWRRLTHKAVLCKQRRFFFFFFWTHNTSSWKLSVMFTLSAWSLTLVHTLKPVSFMSTKKALLQSAMTGWTSRLHAARTLFPQRALLLLPCVAFQH